MIPPVKLDVGYSLALPILFKEIKANFIGKVGKFNKYTKYGEHHTLDYFTYEDDDYLLIYHYSHPNSKYRYLTEYDIVEITWPLDGFSLEEMIETNINIKTFRKWWGDKYEKA